jgi:uncharacterized protein (DUF433 family)
VTERATPFWPPTFASEVRMRTQAQTRIDPEKVVSRDPEIHSGDLVFAGTRVPVSILIDYLTGGHPLNEFLQNYPTVERWQAEAFLELSAEGVDRMRNHDPRAA